MQHHYKTFVTTCFLSHHIYQSLEKHGDLLQLLDQMLAFVILYYDDVRCTFCSNVLTYRMEDAAHRAQVQDTTLGTASPTLVLQTWSSKLQHDYIASNDVDDFAPAYDESANISIVEKLAAQYKKLVELADGIAITNASIASFVDLGSRLRDLLSSFSLNPFLPQRRSATPNRQSATPNKQFRQDDDSAEESYRNDNENDGDTRDTSNSLELVSRSTVPSMCHDGSCGGSDASRNNFSTPLQLHILKFCSVVLFA